MFVIFFLKLFDIHHDYSSLIIHLLWMSPITGDQLNLIGHPVLQRAKNNSSARRRPTSDSFIFFMRSRYLFFQHLVKIVHDEHQSCRYRSQAFSWIRIYAAVSRVQQNKLLEKLWQA